jgi:cytochrome c1
VLCACSAGGHLAQLLRLEPWSSQQVVRWVTFDLPDAISLLRDADVVWAYHPTTRSVKNLVRNARLAVSVIRAFKPDVIVSSGAAIAVPFFWIGKLFGVKTVYVEVVDRIDTRTLTARLVAPVTDLFLAQDAQQIELFPSAHLIGRLL